MNDDSVNKPPLRLTLAEQYWAEIESRQVADTLTLATSLGLFEWLADGRSGLSAIAAGLALPTAVAERLVRVMIAIGRLEQYGEALELSQVAAILERGRTDEKAIGIAAEWNARLQAAHPKNRLASLVLSATVESSEQFRRRAATRQWSLTASAIQAAEAIEASLTGDRCQVLELGGGAGVFSAALAYRCPAVRVTSIDSGDLLTLARSTYSSIGIEDRWTALEGDYRSFDLALGEADVVLLPSLVQLHADPTAVILLGRACDALKPNGMVAIVEMLEEPEALPLANALESWAMMLDGCQGGLRSSRQMQRLLTGAGFGDARWGVLDRGPRSLGLVIATKTESPHDA